MRWHEIIRKPIKENTIIQMPSLPQERSASMEHIPNTVDLYYDWHTDDLISISDPDLTYDDLPNDVKSTIARMQLDGFKKRQALKKAMYSKPLTPDEIATAQANLDAKTAITNAEIEKDKINAELDQSLNQLELSQLQQAIK